MVKNGLILPFESITVTPNPPNTLLKFLLFFVELTDNSLRFASNADISEPASPAFNPALLRSANAETISFSD